jgi:hypothetical protein
VSEMSDVNKAHTMKYIQNLSKLSIVYCSKWGETNGFPSNPFLYK